MPEHQYFLSEESERLSAGRELRRSAARGDLTRIASGIYVPTSHWRDLAKDDRHRLFVHAVSSRHLDDQLTHDSAAALWGLPSLGPWPARIHTAGEMDAPARSTRAVLRHGLGIDPNGTVIDGRHVTSLARTVIDVARSTSFARGVAMADQALRGDIDRAVVTPEDLHTEVDRIAGRRGAVRARRVAEFADGRSENAGESLCRVQFHALGLPAPDLQKVFIDRHGRMVADFYFEEFDLAAEFDGDGKYLRTRSVHPELTEAEVVLREKRRENRLRRLVRDVARFDWKDALDRRRMTGILRDHGLRT